jgi:hypothetical protein
MSETNVALYAEQDVEYFKQMTEGERHIVIEQMISVSKHLSDNYAFLENAPWYKRALSTLSGKMRKTQREIAADHALMSMYCIQIMREFVERGFITQARISVVEEKLNELYAQFSRLLQATGCAFKDAQDYTTLALAILSGHYSDTLLSALKIYATIQQFDRSSEQFNIVMEAVRKHVPSNPKSIAMRLLELQYADKPALAFYRELAEGKDNAFFKAIRRCIRLCEVSCFDDAGVSKVLSAVGLENEALTLSEFITRVMLCDD